MSGTLGAQWLWPTQHLLPWTPPTTTTTCPQCPLARSQVGPTVGSLFSTLIFAFCSVVISHVVRLSEA